ncbi:sodium/hydrogen exchanger [Anaeramoeba flamelloides]|uniref:Sodium/hydrogen exchanger n=1 Tax=Anaeramoeba flamelloides TaxID=1746091 RepID=A0ABQ8YL48_9EUKA|nr:sodium/hydrogen exchanger [Anaeramoeba flamelloides]
MGETFQILFTHLTNTSQFVLIFIGALFSLITIRMMIARYNIRFLPESALIIVVGIVIGLIVYISGTEQHTLLKFDSEVFFLIFIPPIILEAGFFLDKDFFFHNLRLIILYAVFGTILNTFLVGVSLYLFRSVFGIEITFVELLTFGSLISAVDPVAVLAIFEEAHVNKTLHILVSGESILNDSVSIVLYQLFLSLTKVDHIETTVPLFAIVRFFLVSVGGILFGFFMGLFGSWLTKFTNSIQLFEPWVLLCIGLLSYQLAEVFSLSGIVSILFCGITLSKYANTNLCRRSSLTFKRDLKSFASMNEAIIFLLLGTHFTFQFTGKNKFGGSAHEFNFLFTCLTLFFILFYRFVVTFFLTLIANRKRITKVRWREQLILSYSGLRGAIAFALALSLPDTIKAKNTFISTTLIVVIFTVFLQGGTIKFIMKRLHLKFAKKIKGSISSQVFPRVFDHVQNAMFLIIGGSGGSYNWGHKFHDLDNFLQKLFVRGLYKEEKHLLKVLNKLREAEIKDELDEREKRRLLIEQAKYSSLISNPKVNLELVIDEKRKRLFQHQPRNEYAIFPKTSPRIMKQNKLQINHNGIEQAHGGHDNNESNKINLNRNRMKYQKGIELTEESLYKFNQENSSHSENEYYSYSDSTNDLEFSQSEKGILKYKTKNLKPRKGLYASQMSFPSFASSTDLEHYSSYSPKDIQEFMKKIQSKRPEMFPYSRINAPDYTHDSGVNTLPVLVRRGHTLKNSTNVGLITQLKKHKKSRNYRHTKKRGYMAIRDNILLSNVMSRHFIPSLSSKTIKESSSNEDLNSIVGGDQKINRNLNNHYESGYDDDDDDDDDLDDDNNLYDDDNGNNNGNDDDDGDDDGDGDDDNSEISNIKTKKINLNDEKRGIKINKQNSIYSMDHHFSSASHSSRNLMHKYKKRKHHHHRRHYHKKKKKHYHHHNKRIQNSKKLSKQILKIEKIKLQNQKLKQNLQNNNIKNNQIFEKGNIKNSRNVVGGNDDDDDDDIELLSNISKSGSFSSQDELLKNQSMTIDNKDFGNKIDHSNSELSSETENDAHND